MFQQNSTQFIDEAVNHANSISETSHFLPNNQQNSGSNAGPPITQAQLLAEFGPPR